MALVAQVSDPHLSGRHGYFYANWRTTVAALSAASPDLVVVSGDLSVNGSDDDEDVAFARARLDELPAPWVAIPGNHDIGEEPTALHLGQPIDDRRRDRFLTAFGTDRFVVDLDDGWRVIGIDSQVLDSGTAAESDQDDWLAGLLATDRWVGVFTHKPLFLDDPEGDEDPLYVTPPAARRRILAMLASSPTLRFVASGHLHQHRTTEWRGVTFAWAPSCAFPAGTPLPGATADLGYLTWSLAADGRATVDLVSPPGLVRHDLAALKGDGAYEFLYQTPPCPPELVAP